MKSLYFILLSLVIVSCQNQGKIDAQKAKQATIDSMKVEASKQKVIDSMQVEMAKVKEKQASNTTNTTNNSTTTSNYY